MMMHLLASYAVEIPEDLSGKLGYGLGVAAIGLLIVFAVLAVIMLIISLFRLVFGRPRKKKLIPVSESEELIPAPAPVVAPVATTNQEELIAVLAAAVAAYEGCDVASSRYRIRSFRRIL
ncbi:MAG: OadG family protein [Clostridia bacterium]|jgi:sodium pump decarboxylase gamma subunit|nr:OadG family protein [Clostridia bacterium]MBQ5821257.1 OadG family protein [Clostridia bacterium]